MAILSSIDNKKLDLRGYASDPMHAVAEQFLDVARGVHQESGYDIFRNPGEFFTSDLAKNEMKKSFVEGSFDQNDPRFQSADAVAEHVDNMEALFENDVAQIQQESTTLGAYNPVIGMALPMHKNILMNAVFDQVMPKDVARSPKFTLTMETRTMVDVDGNEFDIFAEQNKIKPAVDASIPSVDFFVAATAAGALTGDVAPKEIIGSAASLGGNGARGDALNGNLVHDVFTADQVPDNILRNTTLSMKTMVKRIIVTGYAAEGDLIYDDANRKFKVAETADVGAGKKLVFDVDGMFNPGYGAMDRVLNKRIALSVPATATTSVKVTINLMGNASQGNKIMLMSAPAVNADTGTVIATGNAGVVEGVIIHAVVDVSTAQFPTVKFKWSAMTSFYEIPEAPHITCTVSPEEVKDIQALYDVNQVTKLMSMMRLGLLHWKDDSILQNLNDSFLTMPDVAKVSGAFDFAPPLNYNNNPVEWRKVMFMDNLDQYVTRMLQVLNDENMTVAVFGRPDLIRRISPQSYTYQTPSNIGPVELDFKRTVVTSEHRVYNFISSQKMRNNNNLIVLLIPRNSMRITYKVIDYQMYISSEIRDTVQYQTPAMTCFERWLFLQYQPVQGRIRILNPSGLRENVAMASDNDYIGINAMNDNTANTEQYSSEVNGVIDAAEGSPTKGHIKIPAKLNNIP